MDMSYNTHGTDEKYLQHFSEDVRRREHLGGLGIDGKIILKYALK
jgi:hypothetical protein